jgi:hypothetical protein
LRPFGVPIHVAPSRVSTIAWIVFDSSPYATVYVVNLPFWYRLSPPDKVPAHTLPSCAGYTAYTLSCASPCATVIDSASAEFRSRSRPPSCVPAQISPPGPCAIE